jgi:ABC-2 type transport system ATP-binding protein
MDSVIKVEHLTKDYGQGRGVFDVSFAIPKGEVFGFLGPNGSGKTTTIRHLMGFSKPGSGHTSISGKDCFRYRHEIMRDVGFLPGEVPLPDGVTGWEFIRKQQEMKGVRDNAQVNRLLELFELDPKGSTKRMSLGMKRKLAIVAAFMHDPAILILDEPSNGLDPVMQDRFVAYINEEKKRGKTVLLSSHMFSEVDATCDRVSIIRAGSVVITIRIEEIRRGKEKVYEIAFASSEAVDAFAYEARPTVSGKDDEMRRVTVKTLDKDINSLIRCLAKYDVASVSEVQMSLENYFLQFYREEHKNA